MTRHVSHDLLISRREVIVPPAQRACQDQNFELAPALHLLTGVLFLGFVGVLCLTLANPGLAVPFGIFVAFIIAFFAVPTIFVKSSPEAGSRAIRWADFMERGIATEHGHCSGREATVLVLMLPTFIFLWALAIATIVTFV